MSGIFWVSGFFGWSGFFVWVSRVRGEKGLRLRGSGGRGLGAQGISLSQIMNRHTFLCQCLHFLMKQEAETIMFIVGLQLDLVISTSRYLDTPLCRHLFPVPSDSIPFQYIFTPLSRHSSRHPAMSTFFVCNLVCRDITICRDITVC